MVSIKPLAPPEQPTFSRASTAYLDGVEHAAEAPRYPNGRNLLSANLSAIETGVGGWVGDGAVVLRDVDVSHPVGTAAVKVTPDAGIVSGHGRASLPARSSNEVLTLSAWVKPPKTSARLIWRDVALGSWGFDNFSGLTPGLWQRITATRTVPADRVLDMVYVTPCYDEGAALTTSDIGWFAGVQLEIGFIASPWRRGGPSAILIEEDTTNLFTANQSNGGEDGTASGYSVYGTNTAESSTDRAWQGTRSMKLIYQDDLRMMGMGVNLPSALRTTFYVWVFIPTDWDGGTIKLGDEGAFTGATNEVAESTTTKGRWVRLQYAFTPDAADLDGSFFIRTSSAPTAGKFIYVDGLQAEQKPYPTQWHLGGETRTVERLETPSLISSRRGTVEVDFYFGGEKPSGLTYMFDSRVGNTARGVLIYWADAQLNGWLDGQTFGATPTLDVGWHRAAFRWGDGVAGLWFDGVEIVTSAVTHTDNVNAATIGSRYSDEGHPNLPVDAVRISSRKRTDAELEDHLTPLTADEKATYFLNFKGDLTADRGSIDIPHMIAQSQTANGSGAFIQFAGRTVPVAARSEHLHNVWEFEALYARDEHERAADLFDLLKTTYNSPDGRLALVTKGGLDYRINVSHPIEVHSWSAVREPGGIIRVTFQATEVDG